MNKLLLALGVGSIILLTSCDKNKGEGEIENPLTSEQNKELIQEIGVEFVNEMATMQEQEGVGALTSFGILLDGGYDDEGGRIASSSVTKIAKAILGFTYQKASATEFGYASSQIAQDEEDEITSLEELFDENTGTYTWNFDTEDYDYEDNSSDALIFKFPSEVDGTSNNATLTLTNYSSVQVANPIDEDYEGDLPTSLDVTLDVDGTTAMTYGFEIDYNSEGIPESVDTDLTVGDFSLIVGITNTKTVVGYDVNFTNGSKTLIAVSTSVNGDFTEAAIDAADENEDPTEVVTDGSFSLTMLDLKFDAEMDFASLWDAVGDLDTYYDSYDDDPRPDLEGNATKLEEALNEHGVLKATYVSTGKTAADVEFYTYIEDYSDGDYSEEYIELGARMVFEDGSKVDVEDFVESGFDGLEDAINDLINQINADLDEDYWIDDIDFNDIG